MKVFYRRAASDDVARQFRYYLLTLDFPEIALRFRDAIRKTILSLHRQPSIGPRCVSSNPQLKNLRSWPAIGFEAQRIYYLLNEDVIYMIRILHSKRDVKTILEGEDAG